MLRITIEELEELRLKLLAAIFTGAVHGEMARMCQVCALELDGLSVLLREAGESAICPPADELGHLIQTAIEEMPHSA